MTEEKDVTIELNQKVLSLVDKDKNVIATFDKKEWGNMEDFASENNVNIQYQPKDLFFDFDEDDSSLAVFFDSKYMEDHGNLRGTNVINLPLCIDPIEEAECYFAVNEGFSKKEVKKALEDLGAKRKKDLF